MIKLLLLFIFIAAGTSMHSQAIKFRKEYTGVTITSISQTSDGGYILSGYSSSFGLGSKDIVLIKTDSMGMPSWSKTFGNTINANADDVASNAVEIPGSAGGYYLAGQFWNQSNQSYDVYVLKTDSSGNKLWSKTMYNGGYDKGMRVANAAGGGCYLTGWLGNSSKGYLAKLDAGGNILWQSSVFSVSLWILQSGEQTFDGGMIACGYDNELGVYEMWIVKTNSSGTISWQKGYAIPGTYNFCYTLCETSDHGFMLGGGSSGLNLVKTDSNGVVMWSKSYSGPGASPRAYSVQQCSDGGYITLSNDISNNQYLMKTDSAGNVAWTMKYTGGYYINTVEQTTDGGFILAMGSEFIKTDTAGISGCSETSILFTSTPLTISTRTTAATASSQSASAIAADGSATPSVTFTLPCPVSSENNFENTMEQFTLFPNPVTGEPLTVSFFEDISEPVMFNAFGQEINIPFSSDKNQITVDCRLLPQGIYILQFRSGRKNFSCKVVKK